MRSCASPGVTTARRSRRFGSTTSRARSTPIPRTWTTPIARHSLLRYGNEPRGCAGEERSCGGDRALEPVLVLARFRGEPRHLPAAVLRRPGGVARPARFLGVGFVLVRVLDA